MFCNELDKFDSEKIVIVDSFADLQKYQKLNFRKYLSC